MWSSPEPEMVYLTRHGPGAHRFDSKNAQAIEDDTKSDDVKCLGHSAGAGYGLPPPVSRLVRVCLYCSDVKEGHDRGAIADCAALTQSDVHAFSNAEHHLLM